MAKKPKGPPRTRRPAPKDRQELQSQMKSENRSFANKVRRASKRSRAIDKATTDVFRCLLGRRNRLSLLIMSSLPARIRIAGLLCDALLAERRAFPRTACGHVTILSGAWETSSDQPDIDIKSITTACRPVLSAMSPNWLAVIELQAFRNVGHPNGGFVISVHVHAIVWGIGIEQTAEAAVSRFQGNFIPSLPNVAGIQLDWIGPTEIDLERAVSYPWKAPHRCKTLYVNRSKGKANLHESEAGDRFIRYVRLLELLSRLPASRVVFASGRGGGIRADSLRQAIVALKAGERDRSPPVHPDCLINFWAELWTASKVTRFKIPRIRF